jgi:hypothetical protein
MSYGLTAPADFQLGGNIGSGIGASSGAGASSGMGALGAAAGPLMIFGAISSAYGAYSQTRSLRLQLQLQSDLSAINARLAESSAQSTLLAGQHQEQNARLKTAALKGSQRAGMAANGIDLGSGTATNVLTTTDVMGEIDAETINANAVRAAWGYRTQAVNAENTARMSAANAEGMSSTAAAASSLLGSAGSVASSYYMRNKAGG